MTRILSAAVLAAALAAVAADAPPPGLDGSYKLVALSKRGEDVPEEKRKDVTVQFKGDTMTFHLPMGRTAAAKVAVDAAKSPKTIDIAPTDGPEMGKTFLGIYKLEAGELVIAFAEKGDRPAAFKPDGETAVMRLKKE